MIDGVGESQTTQLHGLKFEGQAKQQVVQQVQNETVQTGNNTQAEPENKPEHRGHSIDVSA